MDLKSSFLLFYSIALIHTTFGNEKNPMPPVITYQSSEDVIMYYVSGQQIHIPCQAEGVPLPEYKWKKDGKELSFDRVNDTGMLVITAENDTAGQYQCFALNEFGNASSNPVFLRSMGMVNDSTEEKTAIEGNPFKLTCKLPQGLVGKEENIWTLLINNKHIPLNDRDPRITSDPNGTLWFSKVEMSDDSSANDNGIYAYMIRHTERDSTFVCKTQLKVISAPEADSPSEPIDPDDHFTSKSNETAMFMKNKKLYCIYGGRSSYNTTWKKDDASILTEKIVMGKSQKYIEIPNFTTEDEGTYTCFVQNGNETYQSHDFSVNIAKPYFKTEPQSIETTNNKSVEFSCDVAGSPKPTSVDFTYNGIPLEDTDFYKTIVLDDVCKIIIKDTLVNYTGTYGFNTSNIHGYVYKEVYLLVQQAKPLSLTGIEASSIEETINGAVSIECLVDGVPAPVIEWEKNDEKLENNTRITISADTKILNIMNLTSDDAGEYICIAKNEDTITPVKAYTSLRITNPGSSSNSPSSDIILLIVAIVVIAIILLVVCMVYKKYSHGKVYRMASFEDIENHPRTSETNRSVMAESPSNRPTSNSKGKPKLTQNGTMTAEV